MFEFPRDPKKHYCNKFELFGKILENKLNKYYKKLCNFMQYIEYFAKYIKLKKILRFLLGKKYDFCLQWNNKT